MVRKVSLVLVVVSFLVASFVAPPSSTAQSTLTLNSNPSGVAVLSAGERLGTTPLSTEVGPNRMDLRMTGGNVKWMSSIEANGDVEMTVNLDSVGEDPPYRILVLSKPKKARVIVNGKLRGRTPWTGSLSPGDQTLVLRKEGLNDWKGTLDVQSSLSLTANLKSVEQNTMEAPAEDKQRSQGGQVKARTNGDDVVQPVEDDVKLVMPLGADESRESEAWGQQSKETTTDQESEKPKTQTKDTGDEAKSGQMADTRPAKRSMGSDESTETASQTEEDTKPDRATDTQPAATAMKADTETAVDTQPQEDTEPASPDSPMDDAEPEADTEQRMASPEDKTDTGRTTREKKLAEKEAMMKRRKQAETIPSDVPLTVESTPAGAGLYVDGEKIGTTPYVSRDFSSGTTTIQLKRDGYRDWEETFHLDEPTQLTIRMKPVWSYLTVRPDPSSMMLSIGGEEFQLNGERTFKVQPGEYDVTGSVQDIGRATRSVSLTKGETRAVKLTLQFEPKVWEFPTTRDVFLRMARQNLGQLVSDFGIRAGQRLQIIPEHEDWAHDLMDDALSVVMNQNAILVVDAPSTRDAGGALDREFKFYIVEMDVDYESMEEKLKGVSWLKRHFDLKIHAKLIHHETGEVQYTKFFRKTTTDRIPASLREELSIPYEPPETEPPL